MKLTTIAFFAFTLLSCAAEQARPDQELREQFWRLQTLRSTAKEQFIANDNQLAGEIQKALTSMQEQCKKLGKTLADKNGLICESPAGTTAATPATPAKVEKIEKKK